jgi:hypothetical protein
LKNKKSVIDERQKIANKEFVKYGTHIFRSIYRQRADKNGRAAANTRRDTSNPEPAIAPEYDQILWVRGAQALEENTSRDRNSRGPGAALHFRNKDRM